MAIIVYCLYLLVSSDNISKDVQHDTSSLVTRATKYNASDISILYRYRNLFQAIDEIEQYYYIIGMDPMFHLWVK